MDLKKFVINKIISLREERNLTQQALGELIGRSAAYIESIESGEKDAQVLQILKFCEVMNVDPSTFYNDYSG